MHDHHAGAAPRFRATDFLKFCLYTGAQTAIALWLFKLIAPNVFAAEFAQPGMIVFWTFILGIPLSLFEYLYHRYLLHSAVLPFLRSMNRAHTHHHGLTTVKAPVTPHEPEKMVPVFNEYSIVEEHQEESMMFPVYAISIFYVVFLILLALPFKLLFPGQPIIASVLFTATLCYTAYELWHQVLHLPFDSFWKPLMTGRKRRAVRHVYAFHLMHHWKPTCNLAVVGFWGLAIWDHIFGTHRRPHNLPLKGSEVNYKDISLSKPRWPISTLDKWGGAMFKFSRKVESGLAKIFLGKKATS
jgi:hypothetical protein